jgi:Enolase C-terminal domain-like
MRERQVIGRPGRTSLSFGTSPESRSRPRGRAPRCCGLTEAMTIARLAEARGLPVINHNFTTDINVAASLHFLASVPNAFIMEYCVEPSGRSP